MKMDNMVWLGKRQFSQKARKAQGCDVSIRKSLCNGQTKARFTFRNGAGELVSETQYVQFSIPDERHIYFMTGDKDTGLKLSSQNSDNRYVQINKERDAEELMPFIGDYGLSYDPECRLYFVSR